ncbi:putative HTH-type transcriptional regulator [Saezia sanguinis]|uniref:Putative HTH-type transcriptional regulator n=2 Tax=Saezia sanguinis TaxID=1965230 RepID=A0A433SEG9_9BURK|nr:putative HTH-type transcriptional regulator [Saezia sanguinis]
MTYSIGAFSSKTGISAYTLRYYEKEQLLRPVRQHNGRRAYTQQDVAWVEFIKRLKDTGMPIKSIQRYAQLRAQGASTLKQRMQMLQEHRAHIQQTLLSWQAHMDNLDHKITLYQTEILQQGDATHSSSTR